MSFDNPDSGSSSGVDAPAPTATLADVLEALDCCRSLSERAKRDRKSAIRCFAKALSLDFHTTPAGDMALFQKLVADFQPERRGLSAARWAVIKSQVLSALATTGFAAPLRTAAIKPLPQWVELLAGLPSKHNHLALSRFARFCSQRGIPPEDVSSETFDLFHLALTEQSLVRNPRQVHRHAARVWNALPINVSCRDPIRFELSSNKAPLRRIPITSFPVSFQEDLNRYQVWCATADPLSDDARAKPLRQLTIRSYASALHTGACAAVKGGIAVERITSLAALTTPEIYTAILRQLHADSGNKASAHATGVATILFVMAKDWLKRGPEELLAIKRLKSKLPRIAPGLTVKNRALLVRFDETAVLQRFVQLPTQLWKEALSDKLPANKRLVRAQMALLIAILQIAPIRRKNACALAFGRHVTWPNGPNAPALLQIPAAETKTSDDYVAEIPVETSRWLHIYRTRMAPAAIGTEPRFLFVTVSGTLKRESCVAVLLERTLLKRLGTKMTMHQFRHVAAKLMLDENPGAYETARQLLGHAGTKNVVRFYGGTNTKRASRHHAFLIERLRTETNNRNRANSTRKKTTI